MLCLVRRLSLLLALGLTACSTSEYRVVVHLPGEPERAARLEVSVLRSCADAASLADPPRDVLVTVEWQDGVAAPLGHVPPGSHGLHGRVWDAECRLYAAGCDAFQVEADGEGTVSLYLGELPAIPCGADETCRDARCWSEQDGGVGPDGGSDPDGGCPSRDPVVVGRVEVPGDDAEDVDLFGGIAYVAKGDRLVAVDVNDPEHPVVRGEVRLPGEARGVAQMERLAAVADIAGGLQIVDLTNPAAPRVIGTETSSQETRAVLVLDPDTLVLGNGPDGIALVDVANPSEPSLMETLPLEGNAHGLAVSNDGSTLFVAAYSSGLKVVTLTDRHFGAVREIDLSDHSFDVTLAANSLVLVAGGLGGLHIIDFLADPLQVVGTVDTAGSARSVALGAPPTALVADDTGGLAVIDLAPPDAPEIVLALPLGPNLQAVTTWAGLAVVVGEGELVVLDTACAVP